MYYIEAWRDSELCAVLEHSTVKGVLDERNNIAKKGSYRYAFFDGKERVSRKHLQRMRKAEIRA